MFHSSSGLCRSALFLSNIDRAAIKLGSFCKSQRVSPIISGFLFAAFEIGCLHLPTGIEFIDRPP